VLVAETESGVVGWASYGKFRSRDGYADTVEHSIYVTPAAQGRGAGTALMRALIERARNADLHAIVGGLDGANTASLRFHERLGFRASTPLPQVGRKFGRWLDLVFVTLILES
jgi:phosphinothricin acetyltransferase